MRMQMQARGRLHPHPGREVVGPRRARADHLDFVVDEVREDRGEGEEGGGADGEDAVEDLCLVEELLGSLISH